MERYIGYARVGFNNTFNLEQQTNELKRYGCIKVYTDVRSMDCLCSQWVVILLNSLKAGDTVVVTSMDRLTCDAYYFGYIYHEIKRREAYLLLIDQPQLNFETDSGRRVVENLLSYAKHNLKMKKQPVFDNEKIPF